MGNALSFILEVLDIALTVFRLVLGDIQFLRQAFPPSSKFKVEDIPDLSGKIALVTGGNTGIGYCTVKALLEHNAKVYLAARSKAKAMAAIEKLKSETGGKEAIFLQLDLGDLATIKRSAQEFIGNESQLHILINNAGVMRPPIEELTKDGYDLQFGTNVLGHFYLTKLLLPVLEATAQRTPKGDVRVVNVASSAIYMWPKEDLAWNTLRDSPARAKLGKQVLYAQSKVGNVLFSNELARRVEGTGIVSSSLNPGNIASDLYRWAGPFQFMTNLILYNSAQGALTSLKAATSEEGRNFNGKYLIPWARLAKPTPFCENRDVMKALWDWCEEQVSSLQ